MNIKTDSKIRKYIVSKFYLTIKKLYCFQVLFDNQAELICSAADLIPWCKLVRIWQHKLVMIHNALLCRVPNVVKGIKVQVSIND